MREPLSGKFSTGFGTIRKATKAELKQQAATLKALRDENRARQDRLAGKR